tara:strand:- start:286 stop:741 length:456 start_codon:yes stop_codon:yes gene_type:complete
MKQMLLTIFVTLAAIHLQAAIAPLSQDKLKKQSELIIVGKVIGLETKVQKSKIEQSFGIHRDRLYNLEIEIERIHKASSDQTNLIKKIFIEAWQSIIRIPPLPTPQGHRNIPRIGDMVKLYLVLNNTKKMWEPILPNGIQIIKEELKAKGK